VEALAAASPDLVMHTKTQRLTGWLVYLFFSPPAVADVANYVTDTQGEEEQYFSNPTNNLLREPLEGAILLVLSLLGMILAASQAWKNLEMRRALSMLLLATLVAFLSIILFIPLPFQRYVVLIIPFVHLWIAFVLAEFITSIIIKIKTRKPALPR
jgi:hypothetical protein